MKQPKRILAYSALALIVMLAAFGAIAFDTSNVALAQGTVPAAPTLTATRIRGRPQSTSHGTQLTKPTPTNSGPGTTSTSGSSSAPAR